MRNAKRIPLLVVALLFVVSSLSAQRAQKVGIDVPITVIRRNELQTMQIKVIADPTVSFTLKEIPNPDEAQKEIFADWLGTAKR